MESPKETLLDIFQIALCTVILAVGVLVETTAVFAEEPDPSADKRSADSVVPVPADHVARIQRGTELFKTRVRGILEKHCLDCHGGESVKADFDLSTRQLLDDSGFLDSSADDSQLVALIQHDDEPFMPLKAAKLSEGDIKAIRDWIDLGAPYDRPLVDKQPPAADAEMRITDKDRNFWSFKPLAKSEPPKTEHEEWVQTPVDRYILRALEEKGIAPNAKANKRVLIRRAYFGLIGLPPTPERVAQFLEDERPEAWGELIDELLASKHYGERWARHWMDVARFAESHGYEQDYHRPHAYHYRDFLIRALNQDMPYDQFVRWQLAGDELAQDDPFAMTATGFLGAGVFPTQLTEAEFESARYDELDDIVATTGVAFLGLSVGCARCHDHKYDPISSRDYYRLAATFTRTFRTEVDINLTPEENRAKLVKWEQDREKHDLAVTEFKQNVLPQKFAEWIDQNDLKDAPQWEVLTTGEITSLKGQKFRQLDDASWVADGNAIHPDEVTLTAETKLANAIGVRVEALTDPSLPHTGPGRAGNGNFVLSHIEVEFRSSTDQPWQTAQLAFARATHQQNMDNLSVAASLDDNPITGWAIDFGGVGKDQAAVFSADRPFGAPEGSLLRIRLAFNHPSGGHAIGRFRLSVTQLSDAATIVGVADYADHVLRQLKPNPDRNSDIWKKEIEWFATQQPELVRLQKVAEDHRKNKPSGLNKVMVNSEGFKPMFHHANGRGYPHFYPETYYLNRGDVQQKKEVVQPGVLQVLSASGEPTPWAVAKPEDWTRTGFDRAALANWITDPVNGAGHLSARVMVNRLWQHHFGNGIVGTPNDFGLQGDSPSHPELLDWLAGHLIEQGWKLKRIHKLIMTSAVYMQSSYRPEPESLGGDVNNRLLWRYSPKRLEAEPIRDSMLAVSGLLDARPFGPGTLNQYQNRRSIYFFIQRSNLIPSMVIFDWPEHLVSIGKRATTTTAPQALSFMNSPQVRRYATAFTNRLPRSSTEATIQRAFQLAYSRNPSSAEFYTMSQFIQQQTNVYRKEKKPNPVHLALIDFSQTLLASNEFIYVD